MKTTVLKFGLISGALAAALVVVWSILMSPGWAKWGEVIGYSGILVAALVIFFGVRSYRENVGGGAIGFGRALGVGLLIALVSAFCYMLTWELLYFVFMPDLPEKLKICMTAKVQASSPTPEAAAAAVAKISDMLKYYDNLLTSMPLVFMEPLPVGLLVSLISAAILRRKKAAA